MCSCNWSIWFWKKYIFTLFETVLEKPTKGSVVIDGVDIMDPKTDINQMRQKIGMVFQQFNLFPHKTVLENVTLAPIKLKGMEKRGCTPACNGSFESSWCRR